MARLDAGEYGLSMDRMQVEGEALASKIAALLIKHRNKCEAHEAGKHRLLADVSEYRVKRVQDRAEVMVKHGEQLAPQLITF